MNANDDLTAMPTDDNLVKLILTILTYRWGYPERCEPHSIYYGYKDL